MDDREQRAIQHEDALIAAFIVPSKRERCLLMLADKKKRRKFTAELGHFRWFDPKVTTPVPWKTDSNAPLWSRHKQGITNLRLLLQSKGAGSTCWVISEHTATDARELSLEIALESAIGGVGSILSCIPGKLAYFHGEDEALLLQPANISPSKKAS